MKKMVPWLLTVGMFMAVLALVNRSCKVPDPDSWVPRPELEAALAAGAAADAELQAVTASSSAIIASKDKEIAGYLEAAGKPSAAELEKDKKIIELEHRVEVFTAQGNLGAALAASRQECAAWAEKFSLAVKDHKAAIAALDAAWLAKYNAQGETLTKALEDAATWKKASADMKADLDIMGPTAAFTRTAHDVQGLAVGVYSAARHKDVLPLAVYAGEKLAGKLYRIITKHR